MKVNVSTKSIPGDWNEVADLEIIIPEEKNNADFVNDVLYKKISKSGFWIIANELRWEKNMQGENVLRYFGATEGRTTLDKVVKLIKEL